MVTDTTLPWYNLPPREFPAKRWLRQHYGFTVSLSVFARQSVALPMPRRFPALVWVESRQPREHQLSQFVARSL
jgi:hypothetical protein